MRNKKTIGLMITYNESHFIKYSLSNLLEVVDEVIILDGSDEGEGTREYIRVLQRSNPIYLIYEEDYPELKTFRDKRQFLLDEGRCRYFGDKFVVIDADEIISEELKLFLKGDWKGAVYCKWYHINGDLYKAKNNYINEIQGIAFEDTGLNYHGRDIVHEDKIPIGRDEKYQLFDGALLHFGTCNEKYADLKRHVYKIYEMLEGNPIIEINMRYLQELNVKVDVHPIYPKNVDENILDIKKIEDKYFDRFCNLIADHFGDKSNELYFLDIWRIEEIIAWCYDNIDGFDPNKIVFKKSYSCSKLLLTFAFNQFVYLLAKGEYKRIFNFFIWKLFGKCV